MKDVNLTRELIASLLVYKQYFLRQLTTLPLALVLFLLNAWQNSTSKMIDCLPIDSVAAPDLKFCGRIFGSYSGVFNYICTYCDLEFKHGIDFEKHILDHFLRDGLSETNRTETDFDDQIIASCVKAEPIAVTEDTISNILTEEDEEEQSGFPVTATTIETLKSETETLCRPEEVNDQRKQKERSIPKPVAKPPKCECCDQTFACNGLRDQHVHEGAPKYAKCEQCPTFFRDRTQRLRHQKLHKLPKSKHFTCTHCACVMESKYMITKHIKTNEKQFPIPDEDILIKRKPARFTYLECDLCGRKFTGKGYLWKHLQLHVQNRLNCDICNQSFKTSWVNLYW